MSEAGHIQLSFFNTIHLSGERLKEAQDQCTLQEYRVLEIMASGKQMTPFEVLREYEALHPTIPITSIRRCLTCLTDKGFLIKCEKMKEECFGKPNHTWTIKRTA